MNLLSKEGIMDALGFLSWEVLDHVMAGSRELQNRYKTTLELIIMYHIRPCKAIERTGFEEVYQREVKPGPTGEGTEHE
jgi:hypothetical protein